MLIDAPDNVALLTTGRPIPRGMNQKNNTDLRMAHKNPPDGGFLFFWLGDQDYSPLRGSPLRGRLAGSPFNLAYARFVEPEVLILVPQKQKPA